jgi:hypothetical protein
VKKLFFSVFGVTLLTLLVFIIAFISFGGWAVETTRIGNAAFAGYLAGFMVLAVCVIIFGIGELFPLSKIKTVAVYLPFPASLAFFSTIVAAFTLALIGKASFPIFAGIPSILTIVLLAYLTPEVPKIRAALFYFIEFLVIFGVVFSSTKPVGNLILFAVALFIVGLVLSIPFVWLMSPKTEKKQNPII